MKTGKILILMLVSLLLFIGLTILLVIENAPLQAFNDSFYARIAEFINPTLTTTATWTGRLTHWYSYTPIILLLLIIPKTRTKVGLPMAVTLAVSAITGPIILKNIFAIERPNINQLIDPGGFGYPSGHSMNAMVFFVMCAIMIWRYCPIRPLKIGFTIFAPTAILSVGLSRIYLGVHTATDVIGGYLIGITVICTSVLIERRLREKFGGKS